MSLLGLVVEGNLIGHLVVEPGTHLVQLDRTIIVVQMDHTLPDKVGRGLPIIRSDAQYIDQYIMNTIV